MRKLSNYVSTVIDEIREEAEVPQELAQLYALLAFVKGASTTLENVHDAWAIWTNESRPAHPSLVPFEDLEARIQEYDRPYRDTIAFASPMKNQL